MSGWHWCSWLHGYCFLHLVCLMFAQSKYSQAQCDIWLMCFLIMTSSTVQHMVMFGFLNFLWPGKSAILSRGELQRELKRRWWTKQWWMDRGGLYRRMSWSGEVQRRRQEEVRGRQRERRYWLFPPAGGKLEPTVLSEIRAEEEVDGRGTERQLGSVGMQQ